MSFRVWFSRMVWIVAAAVALSGCGDKKKKENGNGETEPGGEVEDGLAIAIDPTAPKAGDKVTITVTVTGEIEGKVNIAVTDCGEGNLAADNKDVTAGKATAEIPAGKTVKTESGKKCKITAKAKIGDEDMTETHEFAVAEKGAGGTTASWGLVLLSNSDEDLVDATGSDADGNDFMVKLKVTKAATDTVASESKVELKYICQAGSDAAPTESASWGSFGTVLEWTVSSTTTFTNNAAILDAKKVNKDAAANQSCYLMADGSIGSNKVHSKVVKFIHEATQ